MWTPQGTGVRGPRRNAEAGAALWMEETEPEGRQGPSRRESVTLSQPEQLINEISRVWRAHRQSPQTAAFHGSETRNTGQGAAEKQLTGLGGPTPQEAPRCPRAPLHRSRSCGSRRQRVTTACPGPMSGRRGKPPVSLRDPLIALTPRQGQRRSAGHMISLGPSLQLQGWRPNVAQVLEHSPDSNPSVFFLI